MQRKNEKGRRGRDKDTRLTWQVIAPYIFLSIEFNFCHSSPCKNDGTCTPKTDGFDCDCKQGFFGKTCEGDIINLHTE